MFKVEDRVVNETDSPCLQISYSLVRETDEQTAKYTMYYPNQALILTRVLTNIHLDNYNLLSDLPILGLSFLRFIIHTGATQCCYSSDPVTCLFEKPSYLGSQRLKAQAGAKWPRFNSQPSFLQAVCSWTSYQSALTFLHLWHGDVISTWFLWLLRGIKGTMPIKCLEQDLAIENARWMLAVTIFHYCHHHHHHGLAMYLGEITESIFFSLVQRSDPCLLF